MDTVLQSKKTSQEYKSWHETFNQKLIRTFIVSYSYANQVIYSYSYMHLYL